MTAGSRSAKRISVRYFSGALIAILVFVLLLHPSDPTSFRKSDDDDSTAPGHESATPPEGASDKTSDGFSPALNDAVTEGVATANGSEDTSAAAPIAAASRPQLDVVIAHHSEEPHFIKVWTDSLRSVPYMRSLGLRIRIYTKGSMEPAAIKAASGADEVVQLANVGREGGTYLYHLLSVYDDPPSFTLFAQAKLKKAQEEGTGEMTRWLQDRLWDKFDKDMGFMSMDRKHDICYCGHCADMGRDDVYPLWPQLYTMLQGRVCQRLEGHILSFNGHFIVSRKRILARSRETYQYLQSLVDAPGEHWIHSEPEPRWFEKDNGKSQPSNPKFGHTLERLWHTIFDCDDPANVTDCDTEGMKVEGPGGCSCRDGP